MADRLAAVHVPVTRLFWDKEHTPALPHEYQVHLKFPEARQAFEETMEFIKSVSN
ncbi:hypothetical protein V3C33_18975 [Micrococcaceae bacterium Sec5.7]